MRNGRRKEAEERSRMARRKGFQVMWKPRHWLKRKEVSGRDRRRHGTGEKKVRERGGVAALRGGRPAYSLLYYDTFPAVSCVGVGPRPVIGLGRA